MTTDFVSEESTELGRRTLMKVGTVGAAAAIAGVGATMATASPAAAAGGKAVNLWVVADFGTFTQAEAAPSGPDTGPFYIGGDIFARSSPTGPVIGRFECWGFIHPGGGVVNQEFRLDGRGKILIAGVEGTDARAVTGGTGDFAAARGQGVPSGGPGSADGDSAFTIDFNLTGASGPPIT